jgi:hypothetical protein
MTSATSSPRGKSYRYYSCTAVRRRGNGECLVRAVAAAELEAFIVDRIRDIGRDPALLQETLRSAAEDREREHGQLEQERRMLQAEHQQCRSEARRLVGQPALADRMAVLDERVTQIETRLAEIQRTLEAIENTEIDSTEASKELAQFDPVWDALVPREQASLLQLLIARVDYDPKEVAITFRPTGIVSLVAPLGQPAEAAAQPLLRLVRDRDRPRRLAVAAAERLAEARRMGIVPGTLDEHAPHVTVARLLSVGRIGARARCRLI